MFARLGALGYAYRSKSRKDMLEDLNIVALIFYLISFFTIYAGKIEIVHIDKKVIIIIDNLKKGIIRHKLLNCFLSKIEYVKQIDNIKKIEMIKRGRISYSSDTSRYFVRIRFKDKTIILFGETLSYLQYRMCLALLKGEVLPEIAKKSLLIDETIDEITLFNQYDNAEEVDYTKED